MFRLYDCMVSTLFVAVRGSIVRRCLTLSKKTCLAGLLQDLVVIRPLGRARMLSKTHGSSRVGKEKIEISWVSRRVGSGQKRVSTAHGSGQVILF